MTACLLAALLSEKLVGLSAKRSLPKWRCDPFLQSAAGRYQVRAPEDCDVVLLADTFNNYFEPENAVAALRVLEAAGHRVHVARAADGGRPLCCGRTFLSVGMVNEARYEARRLLDALLPYAARGVPVVGLEPSCLLTLRDELGAMFPGDEAAKLGANALLFEEFLAREANAGRLALELNALPGVKALLHGHCHQKAFGAMPAVERALKLVPGLAVETVESSCCGMAGAFGYEAKHYDVSMKMAEASLLPESARRGRRDADRRRRHQLPASDRRRRGPRGGARRAGARAGARLTAESRLCGKLAPP